MAEWCRVDSGNRKKGGKGLPLDGVDGGGGVDLLGIC